VIGQHVNIGGNIDVNGNVIVASGIIQGQVTHPSGSNYYGPSPGGGEVTGTPHLPELPEMPEISTFPSTGKTNINSSRILRPGSYGNIILRGNQTITLSGPGVYVFNSIKNSGRTNKFIFDFGHDVAGAFKIYVKDDVDLGKVNAKAINGGDATRIYSETHGKGYQSWSGKYAWIIGEGSTWLGTVWAPFGGINIGSFHDDRTVLTGALFSTGNINIQNNITINYAPFTQCSAPTANAGDDKVLDCSTSSVQLDGTASTNGLQYSWAPLNNGNIVSGATTLTPTVNAVGTYVLTVTNPAGGCTATDTAIVTFSRCILPYYPPPEGGKIRNLIGAELNSLAENFGFVKDTTQNIFILRNDSVMIEVIALRGKYEELLSLLQTPAYGMTNLIDNGPNTLIISGEYPIKNLLKLDSLGDLIDYCRPLFPSIGNAGIVKSQGDTSVQSYFVREGYDLTGEGVKVGVISNSYNTLGGASTDVANGDLPGTGNPDYSTPVEV
jgi:hypothetical protein